MVKDRLSELQAKSDQNDKEGKKKQKDAKKGKEELPMTSFLRQVNKTEMLLKSLQDDVTEIKRMQGNLYCSPSVKEEELQKMEMLSDRILAAAVKVRKDIELMSAESSPQFGDTSRITINQRVHTSQIDRLSCELRTILNDFRKGQSDYIEKTKARLRKQKLIIGEDANGTINENEAVFTGDVIVEMQTAKNELQDLYEREKELLDLEKQIHEVNQLFKDVSILISEQGETIDHIETNVNRASSGIKAAVKSLEQGEKNQSSARRKKLILFGIIAVVLIILIIILAIIFGRNS